MSPTLTPHQKALAELLATDSSLSQGGSLSDSGSNEQQPCLGSESSDSLFRFSPANQVHPLG